MNFVELNAAAPAGAPAAVLHNVADAARIKEITDKAAQIQKIMCDASTASCQASATSATTVITGCIATSAPSVAPLVSPCVNAGVNALSQSAQSACHQAIQSQSCQAATRSSVTCVTSCLQ